MTHPTCPQCDCVAGCQAKPELCPNVAVPVQQDTTRLDWLAMYGSFGADSSSGRPGGNGQKRVAATRKNIDAAMAQTEGTK